MATGGISMYTQTQIPMHALCCVNDWRPLAPSQHFPPEAWQDAFEAVPGDAADITSWTCAMRGPEPVNNVFLSHTGTPAMPMHAGQPKGWPSCSQKPAGR